MIQDMSSGKALKVRSFSVTFSVVLTSVDRNNASFLMVDGLNGEGVSFQYKKSPNYYLIVDGNELTLSYRKHSKWFLKMASFKILRESGGSVQIESAGKPGYMLAVSGSVPIVSTAGGNFMLRSPVSEPGSDETEASPAQTLNPPARQPVSPNISQKRHMTTSSASPEQEKPETPEHTESIASLVLNVLSTQAKAIKGLFTSSPETKKKEPATDEVEAAKHTVKEGTGGNNPPKGAASPAVLQIPPMGDMAALNDFVDTGTITTTMNLLKELYGKLTPEQEASLRKQFDQYYEYPCEEVKEYFRKLNRELYRLVTLKMKLSVEMSGYGQAAAESTNALAFQNEKMAKAASRHLLRRRKNILAIQQQLSQINYHLNSIGTPPNARELKEKHEKAFEELMHMASKAPVGTNTNANVSGSLDGTWEIGETDVVEGLFLTRITHIFALARKKSADIPNADNHRLFMEPLDAQKVFFKTMANLGDGYLLLFYAGYHKRKGWDAYDTMIVKRVSDSVYAVYSNDLRLYTPWVVYLHPKEKILEVKKDIFWGLDSSMEYYYNFKFHKTGDGRIMPKIKFFGNYSWNDMEKIYMKYITDFQKLTKEQKQIDFALIKDDESYNGSILHDFALSRHNQMLYEQRRTRVKDLFPLDIQKDNFVLDLEKEDVVDRTVYLSTGEPKRSLVAGITYSLKEGWLKIWKTVFGERENKKILAATYTWDPPRSQYKAGEVWDANLGGGGLANASWRLVLPTMKDARTAVNFINAPLIDFNAQKKRPMIAGSIKLTKENLGLSGGVVQLELFQGGKVGATVQYQFGVKGHKANKEKKVKYIDQEEQVRLSKKDFYELQIKQLKDDINRYRDMMGKAKTKAEKKHYNWMIMGKEADLQQQKDLLAELKTGQFQHTETRWDKVNAEISANRFLEDSRKYQEKIHQAEYRTDMIRKIGEMSNKMIGQDELGVRDWAERQRKAALAAGDDAKLAAIYAALRKKYQQNLEQGQVTAGMETATMDDYLEAAKYVKDKADTAFMIVSTIQSGGTMYLYAGYTGLTNGISDGIRSGVEHAVKSLNMTTMIAGSAYDGYNVVDPRTGKKMGWKGAAQNTAITVALLGVCHVAIKSAAKTCTVAQKAYSKYAFESAMTAQEREMSLTMVRQYEAKLLKIEKMAQKGESAAARDQALLMEKETQKLMANPHAKNYLKYNGSPGTQRAYIQYENKVKARVEARFKKMMEEKGWDKFKLKEFRNAASGDSVGMDWDIGLIEDKLKTMTINGKEVKVIMQNGKPMTIEQFQKEGEKLFRKAYHLETGYSAEGSFANLTTSANNEAFKDVAILTDPSRASKELADETARTVKYKADHMLGKHSMGFITRSGKMGEACRGLAKEIRTKLIPNLRQSKDGQKFLLDNLNGVEYFNRLETVLRQFGENRISIVEAERSVRRLTGKSLDELPAFISGSLKNAIQAK